MSDRTESREKEVLRNRARKLTEEGMPYQMAMAVAAGRMDLNDAIRRLALKDRVEKLIRDHDLSRALATQIAMGHAKLEDVLFRRRLDAHRDENKTRSCLDALAQSKEPVTLFLHGGVTRKGAVAGVSAYEVTLEGEEPVHKLQIKLAHLSSAWKSAKKGIKRDKERAADPREPIRRPQDRFLISDRRLFGFVDEETPVKVVTLEGEAVRGIPRWFSRYEVAVEVKGGGTVWVFRHAIDNLTPS